MMYLLDTNVVSELRRIPTGRCNESVRIWADQIDVSATYLSVITLLEIELGILRVVRYDVAQGERLKKWFEELRTQYENRIVPIDTDVALKAASLHVPDPKSERDALIAASALVHGGTVVTRNVSDFVETGVEHINPWID